jgi:hypothetical protein
VFREEKMIEIGKNKGNKFRIYIQDIKHGSSKTTHCITLLDHSGRMSCASIKKRLEQSLRDLSKNKLGRPKKKRVGRPKSS